MEHRFFHVGNSWDGYLAPTPIMSIHVLLAWYSRPCLACHGSWRDASEGLQSAAWWLDSPIYRPMAKPKQGFIGWNKSLGARCRFSAEFWHFGLRRLWMSPDAILPHLTSDRRRWDVKMLRISSLMYSFAWHHHNTSRILTHIRPWIPTGSDSFAKLAKLNLAWWSCGGFKRDLMHWWAKLEDDPKRYVITITNRLTLLNIFI